MEFEPLSIPEVVLVHPRVFGDDRGFFLETWQQTRFAEAGIADGFVQDNHSRSGRGVLRGLHYQVRQPQGKLVRVVRGRVFDVAVDLRRSSPSFGRWVGAELSEENFRMLWVPPGFAHGFLVLSESADLVYKCTDFYAPEHERTVIWNDVDIAVQWPQPTGDEPILSARDAAAPALSEAETYP